ncbi:hypothetical protein [Sphingomonas sp. GB1N7]
MTKLTDLNSIFVSVATQRDTGSLLSRSTPAGHQPGACCDS